MISSRGSLSAFGPPRSAPTARRHMASMRYSITASARPNTDCGIVRPRAFAVIVPPYIAAQAPGRSGETRGKCPEKARSRSGHALVVLVVHRFVQALCPRPGTTSIIDRVDGAKRSKITTLPSLLLPDGQRIGQRNENGRFSGTGGQRNGLG